jgi:hypothetical protein
MELFLLMIIIFLINNLSFCQTGHSISKQGVRREILLSIHRLQTIR